MIKTYQSNSNISLNVVLPNKKSIHLAFEPKSNGSSTFVTSSEDMQKSLEAHHMFGKLFRLISTSQEVQEKEEPRHEEETKRQETETKKVRVSDIASAKDYLSEHFGISRTALRSTKSILDKAAENGIEFDGLE